MIFDDRYVAIARAVFQQGNDYDAVVAALKAEGANQLQTVAAMHMAFGMSLVEIDGIVVDSPSWSAERDFTIKIREQFFDDLESQE